MKGMAWAVCTVGLLGGACQCRQVVHSLDPGWQRMLQQPRADAFESSDFFPDGRVMQPPPPHTIRHNATVGPPELTQGHIQGRYVKTIPLPVTLERVQRGQDRFNIFCAPCHGVDGSGRSVVAEKMVLRPPPSLHEPRIRAFAPGRLYATITEGYGFMSSYRTLLDIPDRWAVVAYVQALQLSQHAPLGRLSPRVQDTLKENHP